LCEGKHDAWFFDEVFRDFEPERVYTLSSNEMAKLQRALGNYHYLRTKFSIIVYGDNGRYDLIHKVLPRVIVDTLGKIPEVLNIVVIADEDNSKYEELFELLKKKIIETLKDKNKFQLPPTYDETEEYLQIFYPRRKGCLKVRFFTIPQSLELQIATKAIKYHSEPDEILEESPHEVLRQIALKYYNKNEEDLVRKSVDWLRDEEWLKTIVKAFKRLLEETRDEES